MCYEEHSKEFRTGASNSKATLFIKLFGKTFSRKSFCFAALYKKREPFFQVLSVMKELEQKQAHNLHSSLDDGHGYYNRSYERSDDDFDYADYSTDHRDNNFRNYEKKRRKTNKEIIEDMLKRWD